MLARGFVEHGIAPAGFAVGDARLAAAGVLAGSVLVALLAVLSASRRAAHTAPTRALTEAAVETRLLGPGRMIGGLVAIAAAVPLFSVSAATTTPATAAATSELDAIFLVIAVGCLGPLVARIAASAASTALRCDLAGRRISRFGEPRRREPSLLLGEHAARADGRHELHAALQHDDARSRDHPAAA